MKGMPPAADYNHSAAYLKHMKKSLPGITFSKAGRSSVDDIGKKMRDNPGLNRFTDAEKELFYKYSQAN